MPTFELERMSVYTLFANLLRRRFAGWPATHRRQAAVLGDMSRRCPEPDWHKSRRRGIEVLAETVDLKEFAREENERGGERSTRSQLLQASVGRLSGTPDDDHHLLPPCCGYVTEGSEMQSSNEARSVGKEESAKASSRSRHVARDYVLCKQCRPSLCLRLHVPRSDS
ncbi:hypothetical protein BHE74_00004568 [Ensete ventricosum]|nr:hypothetical protein BHE74_00004568 [Ensete ventricosum]